jgi:predicted transcriptional regulator
MKSVKVSDLMVPLSEYATVQKSATLHEAVLALEKAQEEFDHTKYRHRGILIMDGDKVVGKLGQIDVLRALEPKYREMQHQEGIARYGFTKTFIQSMLKHYHLWDAPLKDICQKAGDTVVGTLIPPLAESEKAEEDATLDEAIHQLVLGQHQSLLVTREGEITGILRLTDVFAAVFHTMKECHL